MARRSQELVNQYVMVHDEALSEWTCFFCAKNHGNVVEYTPPLLNLLPGTQGLKHRCCGSCRSTFYYENVVKCGARYGHNAPGLMTVEEKLDRIGSRTKKTDIAVKVNREAQNFARLFDCYVPADSSVVLNENEAPDNIGLPSGVTISWLDVRRLQSVVALKLMDFSDELISWTLNSLPVTEEARGVYAKALGLQITGW